MVRFKNPCRRCLIKSMCHIFCEKKIDFIQTHSYIADKLFGRIPVGIAILVFLYYVLNVKR